MCNQRPIISVIIPVYNGEKYIHVCIDSVLKQSFSDFEILLIDDGSTDNSGQICENYAEKDKRIRVFHIANSGVSKARNIGIEKAYGIYGVFVDCDDWIGSNYLQELYDCTFWVPKHEFLVISGYTKFDFYNHSVYSRHKVKEIGAFFFANEKDILSSSRLDFVRFNFVWGKLFVLNIVKKLNIHFDERIYFLEDLVFCMEYLKHVNTLCLSENTDYYYRVNNPKSMSFHSYSAEDEYYTYKELNRLVIDLAKTHSLTNEYLDGLVRASEQYLLRVCRSLYYKPYRLNIKNRINKLKTFFSKKEYNRIVTKRNGSIVDILFCVCCTWKLWRIADFTYNLWIKYHKR